MDPAPDSRFETRRRRLLDAAERVFVRDGLRGATMAGIATEAGVVKATAYVYFANKDVAFQAVATRIASRLCEAVDIGFASHVDADDGLESALIAKEALAYDLAHGSPHARDLLAAKNAMAAEAFNLADARILARFTEALVELRIGNPQQAAGMILAGGVGLAQTAQSRDALARDLGRFVRAIVAGLRTGV